MADEESENLEEDGKQPKKGRNILDNTRDYFAGKRIYDKLIKPGEAAKTAKEVTEGGAKAASLMARASAGLAAAGTAISGALAAAGTAVAGFLAVAWPYIVIAIGAIILIILLASCVPCMDEKCGLSPNQGANAITDHNTINEVLAWTGSEENLVQYILNNATEIKKTISQIITDKGTSTNENDKKLIVILKQINDELDKIIGTQGGSAKTRKESAYKIIALIKEAKKYYFIPSATADLANIAQKPIDRIVVRTGEKRIYFYSGGTALGSAPVNIGEAGTINAGQACSGDHKTPLGQFTLGKKYQGAAEVFNTNSRLGYFFINIDGNQTMCGQPMTARGIGIHGEDPATQPINYPRPTYGCIRMFNKDIEIVYPYLNTGTPIEITA